MQSSHGHRDRRYSTIPENLIRLEELCYVERASAHILAGWIPKVPEIEIKLAMGEHLSLDMGHAHRLRNSLNAASRLETGVRRVPKGWHKLMIGADKAKDTVHLIRALYLVIKQHVLELYERYLEETDPIADLPTIRLMRRIVPEKKEQIRWAKRTLNRLSQGRGPTRIVREIEELWRRRSTGRHIELKKALWPPLDRVPRVARPGRLRRGELGALRVLPIDPKHNPKDIGIFLHSFLNEELTTMELICRNTYEHPDMPWEFHLDMARHAGDEARHARIVARCAGDYGVTYGDYPIYTSSYEGQYQFQPCVPGSKKELLWRILLGQTFHEGLALDSLAFEVGKRNFLRQPELARVFSFLLADEVFHVQSGLRWSRYLCGNDEQKASVERAVAHEYFVDRVKRTRAQFVAQNPEKAVAEVEMLEKIQQRGERHPQLPFHRTANIRARKEAGFTDQEIQQIIQWGYVSLS